MIGRRKQYKDVSIPVNNALSNSRSEFESNSGNYIWFYNKVKTGDLWDIKNKESRESVIGSTYPGNYNTPVVLF